MEIFYSCSGSPKRKTYKAKYGEHGRIVIEETGEINVYEMIQSFKEVTDINNIIAKYVSGDTDVINKKETVFMDLHGLPENYFDAVNQINDAKENFAKLNINVKKLFHNNPDEYVAALCNGSISDILFNSKKEDVNEKEVVKEEVKESEVKENV